MNPGKFHTYGYPDSNPKVFSLAPKPPILFNQNRQIQVETLSFGSFTCTISAGFESVFKHHRLSLGLQADTWVRSGPMTWILVVNI